MRVGLSTSCLQAVPRAPGEVIDFVLRAGAQGLVLDDALRGDYVEELARLLVMRRGELPVWAVENVCPASRAAKAQLAALERDEAEAAVAAALQTVELAAEVGGAGVVVLLRAGEVTAAAKAWPAARRDYLRGIEPQDSSAHARLQREREAHAPLHFDALRRSLDRLARAAEAHGVTLALRNPARYLGLPSPGELAHLRAELQGAPITVALDLPAGHLADAMALRPLTETLAAWKDATVVLAADACGQLGGLAPGQGELDLAAALAPLPREAHLVFAPWRGLDENEVVQGVGALTTLAR